VRETDIYVIFSDLFLYLHSNLKLQYSNVTRQTVLFAENTDLSSCVQIAAVKA
jgi:hypothetical protein